MLPDNSPTPSPPARSEQGASSLATGTFLATAVLWWTSRGFPVSVLVYGDAPCFRVHMSAVCTVEVRRAGRAWEVDGSPLGSFESLLVSAERSSLAGGNI